MEVRWLRNPRSLKGTGIVFVGSRGADIKRPSRRGAGVYAWDTGHISSYEVRPRAGSLACGRPRSDLLAALATDELGPDAGKVAAQLVYGERRMAVVFIEQR
jgi:hypothetical protein